MIKTVYIKTMEAGETDGFKYKLPGHLLNVNEILISGRNVEISAGTTLKPVVLLASVGMAQGYKAPDVRPVPFAHRFQNGEELRFTVRNHHGASQRVVISLITA